MSEEEGGDNFTEEYLDLPDLAFYETPETDQPADDLAYVKELGSRLKDLMDGYGVALVYIERWGFSIARVRVGNVPVPDNYSRDWNWISKQDPRSRYISRKFVVKRIVSWFVEAHIRARLGHIARQIRILSMTIPDQTDEETFTILNQYSENLEKYSQTLFHWGGLKNVFLGPSIVNLILALVSPLILGGVIINLSSPADFAAVPPWVKIAIGAILLVIVFFVVQVGFTPKRAVFLGGITEYDMTRRNLKGETLSTVWFDNENKKFFIPRGKNIYTLEKKVFEWLRVPKPIEFPADVWFNWGIYVWWLFAYLFSFSAWIYDNLEGVPPKIYFYLFILFFIFYACATTVIAYRNYRKRVRFGDV